MTHGFAFDMQAVCSGFVYAVTTADLYIRGGMAKRVWSSVAETFSRILDWNDRTTCVLFGDGAGAVVLEAGEGAGSIADRGVLTANLRSDGSHKEKLYVDGGPSTTQTVGHLRMEGREVFKHAVGMITDVIEARFPRHGITDGGRSRLVRAAPGQQRIIDASAKKLDIPAGEGCRHCRSARQYLGRFDSAGSCGRGRGRPDQEGRSRPARSHGWGLYWGAVLLAGSWLVRFASFTNSLNVLDRSGLILNFRFSR